MDIRDNAKFRFQSKSDLQGFLDKIPIRLDWLFRQVFTESNSDLPVYRVADEYSEAFYNHKTINSIENWALKKIEADELTSEIVWILISYVGEVVSFLSGRSWVVDEDKEFYGEENESWMMASIDRETEDDDIYSPFSMVQYFVLNKVKGGLHETLEWQAELAGKTIYSDFLSSQEIKNYQFENNENLVIVEKEAMNKANCTSFARKFVDENLEILQTVLAKNGIVIHLEQNHAYKYIDQSLFEKETIDAISQFYLSKLNEVNEHEMVTLENIFSAYIVEMFAVKLSGYVDYIPVELSSDFRLAANTVHTQTGHGSGIIYADEVIDRIKKKNSASFLSMLLKGQIAKNKFLK